MLLQCSCLSEYQKTIVHRLRTALKGVLRLLVSDMHHSPRVCHFVLKSGNLNKDLQFRAEEIIFSARLQNFAEEAQVLIEEGEARAEAHHAAEHKRMIRVVARIVACRPAPPQELQRLLPAEAHAPGLHPLRGA